MTNATELPANVKLDGQLPVEAAELPSNVELDGVAPGQQVPSMMANAETGLLRVPGAIIGAPHTIEHAVDWGYSKAANAVGALIGHNPNLTADDLDQFNVLQRVLPTPEAVDAKVFGATGVQPYQPTSTGGRIGQAAVTGLGAGLLDPLADVNAAKSAAPLLVTTGRALWSRLPEAVKTALAAGAAQTTQEAAPNTPALAAAAALITHAGVSGAMAAARESSGVAADALRQTFSPAQQGESEAGRVLAGVDNAKPGLAVPAEADLSDATDAVRGATDDIGAGQQPWQAGSALRTGLQARADQLRATRSAQSGKAFATFRDQLPLRAEALAPFMKSPSFRKAIGAANGAVLDEGGEPLTRYWGFDDEDMPSFLRGEAVPPDVLHRVQSQLGEAISAAPEGSAAQRTATMLSNRFRGFLDEQYPASGDFPGYAAIRQGYADASRPLDPMTHGPVQKVLETDRAFGQSRPVFPEERIPDLFLRSNATRADLGQLVDAFGGDKDAALNSLQDHLAGVAQGAVRPDGTLDAAVFDRAMQPYQKAMTGNLGFWFPQLSGKFATAKAAQGTLDTLKAQRVLADGVTNGALRDTDGRITSASFGKWLNGNQDQLSATQSPAALMRLRSIGSVLQGAAPGELADALKSEIAPAAVGMATGGLEGGVLGTLLHKSVQTAFGGLDAKRHAAFAAAIERAVTDPGYAARLTTEAGKRRGIGPARALVRAMVVTPIAVNAGSSTRQ